MTLPFRTLFSRLALSIALVAASSAYAGTPSPHYRVVGYIAGDTANVGAQAAKIDTLIFAFAQVVDGRVVLDAAGAKRLQTLTALRKKYPRLSVVVSVGGWTAGGFSEAAETPESRQRFADSAAQLLVANDADGLDVDWEYPGHHESGIHSSPQDREHFTALLQTVRSSLDQAGAKHGHAGARHYTLSIAAADGEFVDGIDIAAVNRSLDWFNLMTYDFVNAMTPTTGHHTGLHASALTPAQDRTTDRAVQQFLAAGVPPAKLLIGAAFYGREFADVQAAHDGLYQRFGHFQGQLPWPALKNAFIDKQGYVRHWDDAAQAPYLWNAATHRFISYDDPQSLAAKAAYVKAQKLGGIMYWEQNEDPKGELLDAVWRGLNH